MLSIMLSLMFIAANVCPALAETGVSSELFVPMRLQQGLLLKSISYARGTISRISKELNIVVVYDKDSVAVKDDFQKTFDENFKNFLVNNLPIKLTAADATGCDFSKPALAKILPEGINVIYVAFPLDKKKTKSLFEYTTAAGIMTASGIDTNIDSGFSLGILLNKETAKPEIIVHQKTAELEQCDFNPVLYKLSKVVQ